jgi:formate dehydrogenase maturation protein FdhE
MPLTVEQKQDYIVSGGNHCPYCASHNITALIFDGEDGGQPVRCEDCGKEWTDIYKLVDIEEETE